MKWREMLHLAVEAARTEARLAAEKAGDWLAKSPVAPISPAPPTPEWSLANNVRCIACAAPCTLGEAKCERCKKPRKR